MDKLIGSREWHEHCKLMADAGFPVGESFAATHLNATYPCDNATITAPSVPTYPSREGMEPAAIVQSIDTLAYQLRQAANPGLPVDRRAWIGAGRVVIG